MTNSMNSVELILEIVNEKFKLIDHEIVDKGQVSLIVENHDLHRMLSFLKTSGWIQLSYLTAVDWLEDEEFELVYIVFNWDKPVHIQVRTRIPRDRENASFDTIMPIYPGCKYYEREVHEFFGIKFPGNPDFHKQLILEGWDDMPPLLKDFDPKAYSDRKFPKRKYTEDFSNLDGKESKQAQRELRDINIEKVRKGGRK